MKKTDWYPANVEPIRKGVYQREYYTAGGTQAVYCLWDGDKWCVHADTAAEAAQETDETIIHHRRWRGVAK